MKGAWGILLTAAALVSTPAWADTVYRCESPDGSRAYVSKKVKGAVCVVAGQYRASERNAAKPSGASVAGSATPASPVAGSPAMIDTALAPVEAKRQAAPASNGRRLVQGQVYSYIKDGVRVYSSRPPRGVAGASAMRTIKYSFTESCYACGTLPGVNFGAIRLNTEAYRNEIAAAAAQFGVEEAVVRAIIHAESAYRPNAVSRVGAQGLMQLMPATARRFGVTDSFNPAQNIRGGVQYLGWLLKRFNGNLTLAAAGYNAGEGAVDKYKGVPPYSETQRYVQRVAVLADRYRSAGATTTVATATTGSAAGSR